VAFIKTFFIALLLAGVTFGLGSSAALAVSLESVLMPGKLIRDHAKAEGKCENCHVRFEREGQDRLCRDCH
jgi:Zn finger protein HypA/HybF involved in hydrogenase expression